MISNQPKTLSLFQADPSNLGNWNSLKSSCIFNLHGMGLGTVCSMHVPNAVCNCNIHMLNDFSRESEAQREQEWAWHRESEGGEWKRVRDREREETDRQRWTEQEREKRQTDRQTEMETARKRERRERVNNFVYYIQSTIAVISGWREREKRERESNFILYARKREREREMTVWLFWGDLVYMTRHKNSITN